MRYIKFFFFILTLFLLIINGKTMAFAMNTGFSTEILSEDRQNRIIKNISIAVLDEEPAKDTISCFDVSDDRMIALGCSDLETKTIGIYTPDGVFQYGYKFNTGGKFGVEWDGNNIIIYFVRSDLAVSVNPTGDIESILAIQNTMENNTYWHSSVFSKKRIVENTEYTLKNDMGLFNIFASSYSQLVVTYANGDTNKIYDVNSSHFLRVISIFLGVLIVTGIYIFFIARYLLRIRRNTKDIYNNHYH